VSFRNNNRQAEIKELTSKGIIPAVWDIEQHPEKSLQARPFLIGRVAALINDVVPAKQIVDDMVSDAAKILQHGASLVSIKAKL
jgi:hypothetical protein